MAGNLLGPLVGGFLPPLIGIRATFWGASGLIFIAFVFTTFMLRETARPSVPAVEEPPKVGWSEYAQQGGDPRHAGDRPAADDCQHVGRTGYHRLYRNAARGLEAGDVCGGSGHVGGSDSEVSSPRPIWVRWPTGWLRRHHDSRAERRGRPADSPGFRYMRGGNSSPYAS